MHWNIPGTVLQIPRSDADRIENIFSSLFLAGGITLGQITDLTGLEPYTVQNWVKRGLLPPPVRKRYCLNQLCRIITINMLKGVLPMERICGMLGYLNGQLDDESDDIIDDSQLFFLFVRLASRTRELYSDSQRDAILDSYLEEYQEPIPGAKVRVREVLCVMLTAWLAVRMQQESIRLLDTFQIPRSNAPESTQQRSIEL